MIYFLKDTLFIEVVLKKRPSNLFPIVQNSAGLRLHFQSVIYLITIFLVINWK